MIELLRYRWALSEAYFSQMYPVLQRALQGGHNLIKKKSLEDLLPSIEALISVADNLSPADVKLKSDWNGEIQIPTVKALGKTIALIPIVGPLSKYGDMCSLGMQTYQQLLNRANATEGIDGIVLLMDTPGGTVDGTPEFASAVRNSTKPVGVFGDGMVASAGIWISSQAAVIVGNKNNPTEFGSIGVLMGLPNYQNVMDAGNLPKVEIFRASQSTEKARVNSIEPITDEGRKALQEELDSIASDFIAVVKSGRGDKLDVKAPGLFSGRMFDVTEAKRIGLIDAVGTLQTAVNKVAELVKAKQKQSNPSTSSSSRAQVNKSMKFTKLSALLGVAVSLFHSGSADNEVSLTEEQATALDAAEKALTDSEALIAQYETDKQAQATKITELEANVTALGTQVTTLQGEKTTLEEANTSLTAKNTELSEKLAKAPTGQLTTVIPDASRESNVNADGTGSRTTPAAKSTANQKADEIRAQKELTTPKK